MVQGGAVDVDAQEGPATADLKEDFGAQGGSLRSTLRSQTAAVYQPCDIDEFFMQKERPA